MERVVKTLRVRQSRCFFQSRREQDWRLRRRLHQVGIMQGQWRALRVMGRRGELKGILRPPTHTEIWSRDMYVMFLTVVVLVPIPFCPLQVLLEPVSDQAIRDVNCEMILIDRTSHAFFCRLCLARLSKVEVGHSIYCTPLTLVNFSIRGMCTLYTLHASVGRIAFSCCVGCVCCVL